MWLRLTVSLRSVVSDSTHFRLFVPPSQVILSLFSSSFFSLSLYVFLTFLSFLAFGFLTFCPVHSSSTSPSWLFLSSSLISPFPPFLAPNVLILWLLLASGFKSRPVKFCRLILCAAAGYLRVRFYCYFLFFSHFFYSYRFQTFGI